MKIRHILPTILISTGATCSHADLVSDLTKGLFGGPPKTPQELRTERAEQARSTFLQMGVEKAYEKELKASPDSPKTAAWNICSTYGSACMDALRPRYEADEFALKERNEKIAAERAQRRADEEAVQKERMSNPQRSADALTQAEKRFSEAANRLHNANPAIKNSGRKIESMTELGKAWCQGVLNDSKYPPGSTEARIVMTDCYTKSINQNAEQVENAAKESENKTTLLR